MITEASGNLLEADVDALVNTVNTVGVMGKGIALQFKRAYPKMFKAYEYAAKRGKLNLGEMHVWETGLLTGPRFIINFPTKGHWKARSRLADIEHGLDDLVRVAKELGVNSMALPPLGCGHGGLDWREVEPVIRQKLAQLETVDILLYPPNGAPAASDMRTAEERPSMTPGRAALVALIAQYAEHALTLPSLIESQKLMYFLQEAGEPLRLDFAKHIYGPYADNLRHVMRLVEGHFLSGFGDGSAAVQDADPLAVLPGAEDEARPVLEAHPETLTRISRVLALADGFESAYGLELLASVHWVTTHEPATAHDDELLVRHIQEWTPRKGRMFGREHILVASRTLRERGWLREPAAV